MKNNNFSLHNDVIKKSYFFAKISLQIKKIKIIKIFSSCSSDT